MGFPGVWMTESGGLAYRVVPKCACSTIGQTLYRADHGRFYEGDIHDAEHGLHKWGIEASRDAISDGVLGGAHVFTCVRNPYARIVSAFFDKIAGLQRNGNRYRGNALPDALRDYGVEIADGVAFDQIAAFRRFLLFARDTIRYRAPMEPDIHWSPMSSHVGTLVRSGGRYDRVIFAERLAEGMRAVLAEGRIPVAVDPEAVPRFNAGRGPVRAHPVAAFFDELSMTLMRQVYARDFALFGYDIHDPGNAMPGGEVDLDALHAALGAA